MEASKGITHGLARAVVLLALPQIAATESGIFVLLVVQA
jgi:hypothetical protein